MLPSSVVIHYLTVAADVFDEINTCGLFFITHRHAQHLTIIEFRGIPCYFLIYIHDLNV
jgi:hypothetical protein